MKYGTSFCRQDDQDDPAVFLIRIRDEDLLEAPDDAAFLQSLRHSCARVSGVYPPLALVEAYITEEDSAPRVRRLHLITVDLHRRGEWLHRVLKLLTDQQIDRLLEGYCFQILATNLHPEAHNEKVLQTATHLTWILTQYLADTIAWLMRTILGHDSKILCDKDTQQLLTPKFWVLPLYRELLNSASRIRPSPSSERARGCTGLVKVKCKENKERKGKRKYHAGTPHPNDRGGFTQWFGSCSLITTLYVWFPACWAPMVAERLFSWSPPPKGSSYSQRGRSDSGPPHKYSGEHPWHRDSQGAAGSSGARKAMEESDSTEVQYKIRQWSLPGAAIVPVLNVTSRVSWLELDDKALLGSYGVLQEGILCDVFSQKCSAAWQGARAERLTVGIMLPGPQEADDWLNFMLSQKNLWPTFTTRGTLNEEISAQAFSKERKRLQAFHLWMDVKLRWGVLLDRMYVTAPTGKSEAELDALLFDKVARRNRTDPYEEKKYRGAGIEEGPSMVEELSKLDGKL